MLTLGPRDHRGLWSLALGSGRWPRARTAGRRRATSQAAPLLTDAQSCLTRTPPPSHEMVEKDQRLAPASHYACDLTKSLYCVGLSFPNHKMGG